MERIDSNLIQNSENDNGRCREVNEKKKTLQLDRYECGVVFHSLKDKRNRMIEENIPTEDIDNVLMKVIAVIEELDGRKGHRYRETR